MNILFDSIVYIVLNLKDVTYYRNQKCWITRPQRVQKRIIKMISSLPIASSNVANRPLYMPVAQKLLRSKLETGLDLNQARPNFPYSSNKNADKVFFY